MASNPRPSNSMPLPWAEHPFNNPAADVILRSSDEVDFRVHSVILSEASLFFKDMFTLPQPSESQTPQGAAQPRRDGRPVISVEEGSKTLDALLRLCYPVTDPALTDLQLVRTVLAAALKYQMDEATAITTREFRMFAPSQPVRIWAIACILQLEDVANYAAGITVAQSQDISTIFPEEMKEISAGHYFRLLQYHRLQGNVPDNFSFLSPPCPGPSDNKQPESPESDSNVDRLLGLVREMFPDLVCRSSDGVEIPTHKVILAMASPVLRALIINLPPSTPQSISGDSETAALCTPRLDLQEDGKTLAALLHLCYPVRSSEIHIRDIGTTRNLLVAARKYEMHRVQGLVESHLESLTTTQPLAVYFTALHLDLPGYAKRAAKLLLQRPIANTYVPEMEAAPAPGYYRLLRYYAEACDVVTNSLATLRHASHRSPGCPRAFWDNAGYSGYRNHDIPTVQCMCDWYDGRLAGVRGAMAACPCVEPESAKLQVTLKEAINGQGFCSACTPFARRLVDLSVKVQTSVDVHGPVAQIELEVSQ